MTGTPTNAPAGRTVLVLGLGESGLAMAAWCAREGAHVRIWDSRDEAPNDTALAQRLPSAERLRGTLDEGALDGVSLLLKSPGLAPHDARIAAVLAGAARRGVAIDGELGLFARALSALRASRGYAPKVIAVTGTNGKTTTTAMTALLVERSGRRVAAAGNIGPTMLQTLADALDRDAAATPAEGVAAASADVLAAHGGPVDAPAVHAVASASPAAAPAGVSAQRAPHQAPRTQGGLPEVWVLELSSFQLDGAQGFAPDAAAVLNISEDHLDWHGSMAAYQAAKARIYGDGDGVMVLNRDDAAVEAMAPQAAAPAGSSACTVQGEGAPAPSLPTRRAAAGRRRPQPARTLRRFGLGAPTRPGDYGVVTENGVAWLVRAQESESEKGRRRVAAAAEPGAIDALPLQRLMPADALRVRGRHNAANALAALALAQAIGCPLAPMLHALRGYEGEPHRVAFVASVEGVDAFDDSKGTNVGATVAAIEGLGADRSPARLVVILGGDGKGQDFTPLAEPLRRHARAVATLGRDAAAIEAALDDREPGAYALARHPTLEAATRWAFEQARGGDAVLLSPACASLDMFRNYAHRADVFVATVQAIAAERGVVA